MPALRSLIAILFLGLCLASPPLLAQSEPPSAEAVQQSLDKLAERKLAEADQKVAKASLEQTLKFLAARDEALQSLEDLKKRLSDAPRQIEENQRELERLKKTKERPVSERYSGESAARLEMLLNDRTTQQAEWQKALGEANSLSITAETRPERAQAGISSMQARILEIGSLLKAGKESGKTINADRRGELLAEQAALTVQSQLLRQELAGNNLLQDLGKSQHDLLTEKISRLEKETLDLQALISEKRREQSEKTVAELSKEGAQGAGTDSLLSQENAKNLRLSDYLLRATDRLNVLTRRNLETKQQLDNLTQSNQALEEQINVLRGSLLLSRILYKQKQALPKIKADQSLADEIADLRLGQFELNQERDKLATPQQYLDDLLAQQPSEQVTPELRKDLDTLLATRSELLERLNHELNALLNEAITLQLNQKQLLSTSESLRTTLDEQMFWIPSNQPLDLSWFKMTPTLLKNQLTEIPWGSGVRELGEGLVDRPLLFLPLFLLIAALLWKRRYLYDKLAEPERRHRPLQARQPAAYPAGDPDHHPPRPARHPDLRRRRAGPAAGRPRPERHPWQRPAGNGPGLAAVLHRPSHPHPGRHRRAAFPLEPRTGRLPRPAPGPPRRCGPGAGRRGDGGRAPAGESGRRRDRHRRGPAGLRGHGLAAQPPAVQQPR